MHAPPELRDPDIRTHVRSRDDGSSTVSSELIGQRLSPTVRQTHIVVSLRWRQMLPAAALLCVLVGCGDDLHVSPATAVSDERLDGVSVQVGLSVSVVVDGLAGPTQFVVLADGSYLIAEINGGENAEEGRVLHIDPNTDRRDVVVDGLDKPTGLAFVNEELWIMERDRLTRGRLGGTRTIVVEDLPNNGRSEGTLTELPGGRILFDTSGSKRGSDVVAGSGRLFTVDAFDPAAAPIEFASGFKHAYAHTVGSDGVVWTTEMTDGRFDGLPAADEVVRVVEGADHGWPRCVGDNRAVEEFGGSIDECAQVPPSQTVFAPRATPTSIIVPPFASDTLWVALWNERRVVAVSSDEVDRPTPVREVLGGLDRPQHMVVANGAVLLGDFGSGSILRIEVG